MSTKKKATASVSHGEKKTITAEQFVTVTADRLAQAVRRNFENNSVALLAVGNDDLAEAMEDYRAARGEVIGVPEIDLSIIERREY